MAPNKFEKYIKQRLQEREIQPSTKAWNRISEQLEVAERPKSKKFYSYAVAASLIGFLMVAIWYFNSDEPVVTPRTVVTETPMNSVGKRQKSEGFLHDKLEDDEIVVSEETEPKIILTPVLPEIKDAVVKNPAAIVDNNDLPDKKVGIALNASDKLIDTKIAEIVAQVDLLEKGNTLVTDGEIDALLRQAQQEIVENPIFRKDNSVDAETLLADVEDELDKSFRDQIFDALKDGFVKVRTAVADRNK